MFVPRTVARRTEKKQPVARKVTPLKKKKIIIDLRGEKAEENDLSTQKTHDSGNALLE